MPVFISYRHTDREQALAINTRLKQANINTYLDVLDVESQSTEDITEVITRNITKCTHLLAVVSERTAQSWWVPFEIGEATISNRRICSFRTGVTELPQYLEKWPKMTKDTDIDLFISSYKTELILERSLGFESIAGSGSMRSTEKGNAEKFHAELKQKIRRGY
ncbi:toll/interleukin-1 receptor domain-containing protein [Pseudomonas syringae]|uniref:toll/interleukin-1 receptor domain-containing protein n=1 Tax=Pseudomonas syringae TaxID=317 RepID=UPI00073642CD|nr:toll/interleukin-1 receptor domain-containing protein [Pseudomonas syringae]KTB79740.1 molecular chaperone Tir [Pseudomonas syringae pv. syringae PD2766]